MQWCEAIAKSLPWTFRSGLMIAITFGPPALAGNECPIELIQTSQWNEDDGGISDIWADGDVAYLAEFGDNKVHFIDISDPFNPMQVLEWVVPPPSTFASAQDVKVGDGLLFISLDADPNDSVEIVDVSDPFDPVHLSWISTPTMSTVHNTFYHNGYLFFANSNSPDLAVVDLTTFDRNNPPEQIEANLWLIQAGNAFVHDMTVQDDILYVAAWNSGLFVYDVSDIANQAPVLLGQSDPSPSTHAVWPSADGRWAVVTEERPGGPMRLYEITPGEGGGVDVVLRDTVSFDESEAISAHNPVVIGTRVYVSWYQLGAFIFDIDETTGTFIERAHFDTFDGPAFGFDGAWGIYPFLGEDRILVSDITSGLIVLSVNDDVSIGYPEGLVETVHPLDGATLTVEILSLCDAPNPESASVFVAINNGDFVEVPLQPVGGDLFEAVLPPALCGSEYTYYVSVQTLGNVTVIDPPDAPVNDYQAEVISALTTVFFDDFETDMGWTTSVDDCASVIDAMGAWERVDPVPVLFNPPGIEIVPDDDFGDGTLCYLTQQAEPGGPLEASDVDGGPVRLTSPSIFIGGNDAVISYARWFIGANLMGGPSTTLIVEVSGDGGKTWVTLEEVPFSFTLAWIVAEHRLSETMVPADTLTVRFSTEDCPDANITEALIDDFSVTVIECENKDTTPPQIVHNLGQSTSPFSGYIDPRRESDNGADLNQGVDQLTIRFTEKVFNDGGGALDATAFSVNSTGAPAPSVISVDAANNPNVVVTLDTNLTPGSWFTIIAAVQDAAGVPIEDNGNQGPGTDETDRVDVAFLPADIDQSGDVTPFDLLRFRQIVNGLLSPGAGSEEDYVDLDRNNDISPFDLLAFRQLINGVSPATQSWNGAKLDAARP